MKIICPNCHSSYHLDGRKVPESRFKAKCPKCEHKFIIDPEELLAAVNNQDPDFIPAPESSANNTGEQEEAKAPQDNDGAEPAESGTPEDGNTEEYTPTEDIHSIYPALTEVNPQLFAIATIFAANKKGTLKNKINAHKLKIILAVQETLAKMLADDEMVIKIGRGSAYHLNEIPYANGIFTLPYNYFAIICTNKRLLMINIDPLSRRATAYKYQMLYEEIKQVKRGIFLSSLIICRHRGKCRNFTTVKRPIAKEIQEFIDQKINESQAIKYASEVAENICPDCLQPVHNQLQQCPHCRAEFKDPQKAMLKSLALPGWGAIYLGHIGLGVLEILGAASIWTIIIALSVTNVPWNTAISLLLLLVYNGTDSLLTFFLARKGYLTA